MEVKALGFLRSAVALALAAAFIAGVFVPVYTDEVGWRFQERAAIDGVDKLFSDICGPNTLAAPPLFMMPARYFSAYFNLWFADPFFVRVSGILYALVWLVMVLVLIRRLVSGRREQAIIGLVAIGLMGLANTPMLLVLSRPEQPLILAATAALLLAFADRRQPLLASGVEQIAAPDTSSGTGWLRSLAILLLACVAFSYHVKGVVLAPLFLACIYFASTGRAVLLPRIVSGAILAALAVVAFVYWSDRLACPDDPVLRTAFRKQNFGGYLSGIDSGRELIALIGKLLGNMNLWEYGRLALPQYYPMSAWLPNGQVGMLETAQWGIFFFICWGFVALLAVVCMGRSVIAVVKDRRLDPRTFFSLLLLGLMLAWSASQGERNVYEASWVLPLLMLSAVFALSEIRMHRYFMTIRDVFAASLGIAMMISVVMIANVWEPALRRSNPQEAYIPTQPYSIPVFGYERHKPDILAAARKCGIGDSARHDGLLIDELTYFAFMDSYRPQHRLGVFKIWNGTIRDPVAYLKSRGSDGIIVGCELMPEGLRRRAQRVGQFCCLGPPSW